MILLMMTSQFSLSVAVREEVKPDQSEAGWFSLASSQGWEMEEAEQRSNWDGKMSVQRSSQGEEEKMEETEMNNNADTATAPVKTMLTRRPCPPLQRKK